MRQFRDRRHAGRLLAQELLRFAGNPPPVVLALPRGGVPVGFEAAQALRAPLDVLVVRKLGVPGQEELAMGAVASGGALFLNRDVVDDFHIPDRLIEEVANRERLHLEQRERIYRGSKERISVSGRDVILVDDGLATGSSMRVAILALRKQNPRNVIVAAPVGAPQTCESLRSEADDVVCLRTPDPFKAVGLWYEDFGQTTDAEVRELLAAQATGEEEQHVLIPSGGVDLAGDLAIPAGARGLVLFAHGSGSSRHSPRNRSVAESLTRAGFGTLLMDLLTVDEERIDARTAHLRFNLPMLAQRLSDATVWAASRPLTRGMPIGYFGASTGAGAALMASVDHGYDHGYKVHAIVSRGGRPDLAADALERVQAATLLIVGGNDGPVIELNRQAMRRMHATIKLEIVPGATHLFEEAGALERVAELASTWFGKYLS